MRNLRSIVLGTALVCGVPTLVQAQDASNVDEQRVAERADREDKGEWGWIGLLGLAGLLGLKRRDRDDAVRRDTVSTTR